MIVLRIQSRQREEMIDITRAVAEAVAREGYANGAIHLYCQHTTCGLTINEGADPDVQKDLIAFFRQIAPQDAGWRHAEGNSDAHIRSSLLGVSLLVPLENGVLQLGRWQSIYLYEGDGPRQRTVILQALAAG